MSDFLSDKKNPGIKTLKSAADSKFNPPDGFWTRCPSCSMVVEQPKLESQCHICSECGHHYRISARRRIEMLLDPGTFIEKDAELTANDWLEFFDSKSYADRLEGSIAKTRMKDGFLSGEAKLESRTVQVGAFEFSFMGGSMGSVVGEKVARLFDRSFETKSPAIIFHATGGARMQEGLMSLMQMAKTTVALTRLKDAGIPYVSVMTDPTTGGVAASFAMLGDLNIAEPKALIGFAGPRVIQQTIHQKLPEGFQRSEFLLEHGFLDAIVSRTELRSYLAKVLGLLC